MGRRRREVRAEGKPCDVDVAAGIRCHSRDAVESGRAEVRRVGHRWIDDQRERRVVRGDGEPDIGALPDVARTDVDAAAVDLLIGDGRVLGQHMPANLQVQHSVRKFDGVGTLEAEPDLVDGCARRDDEVVLDVAIVAVEHCVDAVICSIDPRRRRRSGWRMPPLRSKRSIIRASPRSNCAPAALTRTM